MDFVNKDSIVRKIWGNSDTVLFIFAGASAEFALNKAVDWLYFTGRLPADPLDRLFSTVVYSQQIIFSGEGEALRAIDKITAIHKGVEQARGASIPDWAYRDVLFMLIDYSIRAYELLYNKLSTNEKAEIFDVFYRVGHRMGINGLPQDYAQWLTMRHYHLLKNFQQSHFTTDLFAQYKKHLGTPRYLILKQVQQLVIPSKIKTLLGQKPVLWLKPFIFGYKLTRLFRIERVFKNALLPSAYKVQVQQLDMAL
ncbi:hypothetical protein GCM10023149_03650 [Mucilaginibacter gynuensis]|uniref:ER-bound oxygenase mpaB/mpaB'/Rubber oxygenase catalytic domain-containing protein n=1 Tax=Mucilaginibacter gynuensis TaxID=1302236 RepID=A0ABP8FRP1_9SPHI